MNENILPFPKATDAAPAGGAAALPANVIPFPTPSSSAKPASNIVPLPLLTSGSAALSPVQELPGGEPALEKNARSAAAPNVPLRALRRGYGTEKRPLRPEFGALPDAGESIELAGIRGAETSPRMDSDDRQRPPASESEVVSPGGPAKRDVFRTEGIQRMESAARKPGAMEWHEERPARCIDRSAPDLAPASAPGDTADRIFLLLLREALLARQYGSDSMAVMLRPDDDTELVLHLSQRDGRLEATVRCERGDLALLRASWAQIQETMALQRVDVSPLQEPFKPETAGERESCARTHLLDAFPFSPASGPKADSLDERPPSASRETPPVHRRRRRRSGTRLTTSRPGWETWA